MLSQLSIFCLTYNRQRFIKRLIKYWQGTLRECKIFILDGSKNEINKSYLNLINSDNINYIHCKNETYFERYIKIPELLKTKYVQLVADDEIFLRSGIKRCINFLEENQSFSSCTGSVILFDLLGKREILGYDVYSLFSNEDMNPERRVEKWLSFTQPNTIYGINRSNYLKKIIDQIKTLNQKEFSAPENLIEDMSEIGLSFLGKTKKINDLMWMRSLENPSMPLNQDKYREVRPEYFLLSEKFPRKKNIFNNFIKEYLQNLDSSYINNDYQNFKNLYYRRLKLIRKNKKKNFLKRIVNLYFLKNFLKKIIPVKIKTFLKLKFYLKDREILRFLETRKKKIIFLKNEVEYFKQEIINFYNEK